MSTKSEESGDRFATFSQPSGACTYVAIRNEHYEATMRVSRVIKQPPDMVATLSEPK